MAIKKKSGLGKGLDAIFAENGTEESNRSAEELKLSDLEPNRGQPRKDFDDETLAELAAISASYFWRRIPNCCG